MDGEAIQGYCFRHVPINALASQQVKYSRVFIKYSRQNLRVTCLCTQLATYISTHWPILKKFAIKKFHL
jgi:hypothetical protein